MNRIKSLLTILLFVPAVVAFAQETSNIPGHVNLGTGFSNWGLPIYGSVDFNVGQDINVGVGASYRSKKNTVRSGSASYSEKYTAFGGNIFGQYYLDRITDLEEEFDFYLGLGIGYYNFQVEVTDTFLGSAEAEVPGNTGISFLAGGRYHFSDNASIHVEGGGGNVVSGLRFGVSFTL